MVYGGGEISMRIKHLVKIHFDRRKPEIDDTWFRHRFRFFAENTLRSLAGQTFRDWALWVSFGVNTGDDQVAELRPYLIEWNRKNGIFTMVTVDKDHNPTEMVRSWAKDADYVYVTRLDSDDLYAPDALQIANDCRPKVPKARCVEASMFRRGYMHDVRTKELGVYHGSSTPFHTMMFPVEDFTDLERYKAADYGDHSVVNSRYQTQVLPDWKFTVLVHGGNFISDMSYGRERLFGVDKGWTVERFLNPRVVFDIDDFCDDWNCLPELDRLKERYPDFRCTLFTIPTRTSRGLLMRAVERDWIEVAVHGVSHDPNQELNHMSAEQLEIEMESVFASDVGQYYTRGFRPPGWAISRQHCDVLTRLGFWVALHQRDERLLAPRCKEGYYVCGPRFPYWHAHTSGPGQKAHAVCKNGIAETMDELMNKWPRSQKFTKVSESLISPPSGE